MILDFDSETFHLRVVTGPLGHGPTLQDLTITHLQAEIEVPAAGVVQLHHEDRTPVGARSILARRFRGSGEVTLATIVVEVVHELRRSVANDRLPQAIDRAVRER